MCSDASKVEKWAQGMFNPTKPETYIVPELLPLAVPIDSCKPHPLNPRVHSERNIKAIMKSIKEFKQDQPIVVSKESGYIIKGTGRWLAMKELKCTHIAAIKVSASDLEALRRGVIDNRTQELSQWHFDLLSEILREWIENEPLDPVYWSGDELKDVLKTLELSASDLSSLNPTAVAAMTYNPEVFASLDIDDDLSPFKDAAKKGFMVMLVTRDPEKGRELLSFFGKNPVRSKAEHRKVGVDITGLEDQVMSRLEFLKEIVASKQKQSKLSRCRRK